MANHDIGNLIQSMPFACALHKFVMDDAGTPCDYSFVDANRPFEEYTGLSIRELIGKRVTEVIPEIRNDPFNWIETYARVTYGGEPVEFQQYSKALYRWYKVRAYSPFEDHFITLIEDITETKRQEQDLLDSGIVVQRQAILLDIFNQKFQDQQAFLEYALQKAVDLTGSKYGYIFFYDEAQKEFNLDVFSSKVLADSKVSAPKTSYKLEETGFWGEVIRQRKAIINNDFLADHPLKRGQPVGHVALRRFLSVPVFDNQSIVATVGLANKADEYTEFDANQTAMLMQSVWLMNSQLKLHNKLEVQGQKIIDILNHVPLLLSEFQEDTTLTFVNDAYCQYFSVNAEELIGHTFLERIPEEEHSQILSRIQKLTPESPRAVYTHQTLHNGAFRWSEWQDVAVFDGEGRVVSYYSIGSDITDRKRAEEQKQRSLSLMNAMFEGHTAPMFLIEPQTGEIFLCNCAGSDFFGYTKDKLVGMRIHDICALGEEEVNSKLCNVTFNKNYLSIPSRLKSGEIRIIDIYSSPILYEGKELLFSVIFDATLRERAIRENSYLRTHDFLTNTFNRKYLEEEYDRRSRSAEFTQVLISCDINGLKKVNDTFGTQIGDLLLIRFSETIQSIVKEQGLLSRIGGDEFAILLRNANEEDVKKLTMQLEEEAMAMAKALIPELISFEVTASFGYGMQINESDSLNMLIKEAEIFVLHRKYYYSASRQSKIVDAIMKALYEKCVREQLHSKRVSEMSVRIAKELGLSQHKINEIRTAGILHDIGKIGIDEAILNKASALNDKEWMIMKQHPLRSARILIGFEEYQAIVPIVKAHHERFDGGGYPDGLEGDKIPVEARIIAVADAFDAMTVKRPYRDAISADEAIAELSRCSGHQFDPAVVCAFKACAVELSKNESE